MIFARFYNYRCNDSSLPGIIPVNRALEFRVVVNDTVDMLGNSQQFSTLFQEFSCLLSLFHKHINFVMA